MQTKPRPTSDWLRVEFVLGQRGIGARDLDLGGELIGFLALDRAIDAGEHLALADPAAGIDVDARHLAALAGHADRLVAPRGERARRGDRAHDVGPPGDDHRDAGDLSARRGVRPRAAAAAAGSSLRPNRK